MDKMYTIMIIDDDTYIGDMLSEALDGEGYSVMRAYSGTEALLLLEKAKPDLALLDLMLPGLSGEELLPKLKDIPVIVVSAKNGADDKVRLLLGGAVDYVSKPFILKELLARITVALRKSVRSAKRLCWGRLTLDTDTHRLLAGGSEVHLTRTEYAILRLLMANPTQVITRSRLLDGISLDTPDCGEGSLKVHMSNLRRKLRSAVGRDCIEAVWGIGFRMAES